jgi:hypothetical protein
MAVNVDVRDEAGEFIAKWRARWPEWALAMPFIAEPMRPRAQAWLALLQEFTDAAWAGREPAPGLAKLAWWQDELGGWERGARRHPLGRVLQPVPAPWRMLGHALPSLRALRPGEEAGPGEDGGAAWAAAVAACEAVLFDGRDDADAVSAVAASFAAGQVLAGGDATTLPAVAARPGTRIRGIQQALARARLRRPGRPVPPWRAVLAAWRGARAAG